MEKTMSYAEKIMSDVEKTTSDIIFAFASLGLSTTYKFILGWDKVL